MCPLRLRTPGGAFRDARGLLQAPVELFDLPAGAEETLCGICAEGEIIRSEVSRARGCPSRPEHLDEAIPTQVDDTTIGRNPEIFQVSSVVHHAILLQGGEPVPAVGTNDLERGEFVYTASMRTCVGVRPRAFADASISSAWSSFVFPSSKAA